jgi:hypothetical protein
MKISPSPSAATAGFLLIAALVASCGTNKAPKTVKAVESTPVPLTACEVTLPATTDLEKQAPQKIVFEEKRTLHNDQERGGFSIRTLNRNNGGKTFNFTLPIDDRLEGLVFSTANSSSVTASLVGHQLGTVKTVTGDVVNIDQLKNKKLPVFTENGEFLGAFPIICSEGR